MDARESGSAPSRSKTARLSGSERIWKALETTVEEAAIKKREKERGQIELGDEES